VRADSYEQVLKLLDGEAKQPTGLLAATLSDEFADDARARGLLRPLDGIVPAAELKAALEEFLPEAARAAKDEHGATWLLPRRDELTVGMYLVDAVEQVYLGWEKDRPALEAALKEANGAGLPKGYAFEKSPD